jgi:hypothetical protein
MDQRTTRDRSPSLPFPTRRHAVIHRVDQFSLRSNWKNENCISNEQSQPERQIKGAVFFILKSALGSFREFGGYKGCMNSLIVPPIPVEHSIRMKAAPTPFVQNKADYNDI